MKTAFEFYKEMSESDREGDPLQELAYALTKEMERSKDRLLDEMLGLVSHLQRAIERLERSEHVNSCGEIQSRGYSIDQLCALREKSIEVATLAQFAAEKMAARNAAAD